ncbi:Lysine--tRNA ligase [Methylocella silvestris BL2]|uniref:Lysine--tRNA ligase n=1 Tax=Methylocella silvestris (strain DSM 15510 / CIP 108128 / LMG 27833 / NCIMB 13906 / BL2) TaxID=395965 RepID=B8EJM4_METSB|nr:EF-P lysine aminoacylase EpmA [Methylocella silvestris]ACK49428.1 Lysine--tRNA ligase [Methylocella silvestris BL2]
MSDAPSPWWRPDRYADRRPFLKARTKMAAAARSFFGAQHFVEVDTAALQISPGNEAHISAFATQIISPSAETSPLYLHSSPEFAMKKLLAAGEERIFSFGHAFRNRERDKLHHPEFTLLEWYRAKTPYQRLIEDCAGLLAALAQAAGADLLVHGGASADPFEDLELLGVAEAFDRYAGVDLLATVDGSATDRDALASAAGKIGVRVVADDSWSDIFSKILSVKIEPQLGHGRATILMDYPASEAALANLQEDQRLAERFELYACGVELANGFGELTDPVEQRRRLVAEMAERQRIYGESYPLDEDFLAALALMPPSSGVALGFDRLVMLATAAERIEQVIWTPVAEAFPSK